MTRAGLRKADRKRLVREIVSRLEDFPRQFAALETAMATFGEDFDLAEFKAAFEGAEGLEAYNRVQAVERGVGRVQNYVAELAVSGAHLEGCPTLEHRRSKIGRPWALQLQCPPQSESA